jgi:hypothetical protein
MAWGVAIRYLDADSTEGLTLLSNGYYLLEDSTATRLYEQVAWCLDCKRFERAEYLPEIADIDVEIAKYAARAAKIKAQLGGWLYRFGLRSRGEFLHELSVWQDAVAEAQRQRRWRLGRQSPPRCLACGSAQIETPPEDGDYQHPGGKGRVRIEITSHLSLALQVLECFTAEGLRLEGVRVPV